MTTIQGAALNQHKVNVQLEYNTLTYLPIMLALCQLPIYAGIIGISLIILE